MARPDAWPTKKRPPLAGVAGLLRTADGGSEAAARLLEGRQKLVLAVEQMGGARRPLVHARALAFAAVAAVCAAAWFAGGRLRSPPALTYVISGGRAGDRGYVSIAEGAESATLRFSDGSEVALAAGSRGRVASTTPDGGDVVLEGGRASVRVTHRARSHWTFDAGPYAVRVTGTAFTVAWSAEQGALDVWMREGRVVVAGPAAPQGVALVAGQHLRAEVSAGSLLIDNAMSPAPSLPGNVAPLPPPGDMPSAAAPVPGGAPSAPGPGGVPSTAPGLGGVPSTMAPGPGDAPSTPAPGASPAGPKHAPPAPSDAPAAPPASWSKLVASGDYDAVLNAARQQGEAAALASRPSGEVRALADAARYRGDARLAARAYATLRTRFAASGEARTAAFLLGRLAEEQQHAPASALRWYDVYLSESPGGPFAGDALGRKMVLTSRASGAAAARGLALDYLRRFPGGAYAGAARDLTK
jgi:FecR-like protein